MIESANRLMQGPPGWCRAALCVIAVAALVLAGCTPPSAPLPSSPPSAPVVPDSRRLEAMRDGLRARAGADSLVSAAMRAAGLTPVFGRRFSVGTPDRPLVAALIAGGVPGHRDSLVAAVGLGADGAAALMEAAGLLAARSSFVSGPPRSILVGIAFDGAASAPTTDATAAVARLLGSSIWEPDAVVSVIVVGAAASAAAPAVAERGLALVPVEEGAGDLPAMAMAAYDALVAASRPTPPTIVSTPDTTAIRPSR